MVDPFHHQLKEDFCSQFLKVLPKRLVARTTKLKHKYIKYQYLYANFIQLTYNSRRVDSFLSINTLISAAECNHVLTLQNETNHIFKPNSIHHISETSPIEGNTPLVEWLQEHSLTFVCLLQHLNP